MTHQEKSSVIHTPRPSWHVNIPSHGLLYCKLLWTPKSPLPILYLCICVYWTGEQQIIALVLALLPMSQFRQTIWPSKWLLSVQDVLKSFHFLQGVIKSEVDFGRISVWYIFGLTGTNQCKGETENGEHNYASTTHKQGFHYLLCSRALESTSLACYAPISFCSFQNENVTHCICAPLKTLIVTTFKIL